METQVSAAWLRGVRMKKPSYTVRPANHAAGVGHTKSTKVHKHNIYTPDTGVTGLRYVPAYRSLIYNVSPRSPP